MLTTGYICYILYTVYTPRRNSYDPGNTVYAKEVITTPKTTRREIKPIKRLSLDAITDIALNKMYQKGLVSENRVIQMGDKFNELRLRTGSSAKATKQTYQNYILSQFVELA